MVHHSRTNSLGSQINVGFAWGKYFIKIVRRGKLIVERQFDDRETAMQYFQLMIK